MRNDLKSLDRKERKRLLKEASDKIGRPFLFNRLMSGILDLLTIVILSVGFFLLFFMPTKKEKYDDYLTILDQKCLESHLYTEVDGKVKQLYVICNNAEDMIEKIEPAIIEYYTTNELAVTENKIEEYNQAKIAANKIFEVVDNEIVLIRPYNEQDVITFYQIQFSNANDHFVNQDYQLAINTIIVANILTDALFAVLISSLIFYLVVPLLNKDGETLFQKIFKICLIDARDNSKVKKWQIFVRYTVVTGVYLLLPIVMLRYNFGELSLLPIAVGIFMVSLTKRSKGPQDYISYTQIILKSHSDPLATYNEFRR